MAEILLMKEMKQLIRSQLVLFDFWYDTHESNSSDIDFHPELKSIYDNLIKFAFMYGFPIAC